MSKAFACDLWIIALSRHNVKRIFLLKKRSGDPYRIRTDVKGVRGLCLNHLTNGPFSFIVSHKYPCEITVVHHQGLEPWTPWLRVRCSTSWANGAQGFVPAPSKPNRGWKIHKAVCLQHSCRSSPRVISIGQLNALLHLHFRPINDIVFVVPYS